MRIFVLVCLGGAAGSGLRYLLNGLIVQQTGRTFPFGILAINVAGSFVMGLLMPLALKRAWPLPVVAMLTTGVLGGFTTYSSFNYDLTSYFAAGEWSKAFGYLAITVVGGLAAGFLGLAIGSSH